jgi:prepilin-type N-terminal cleavage/methylation domain-containing protein
VRRGFTLIELVIVIALIALVGSLVVVNAEGMLRGLGKEPIDRMFQKAVREARFQAASIKESAYLMYDEKTGDLIILNDSGQQLEKFNISTEGSKEMPEVEFEQILPSQGLDSFSAEETVTIKQVVFRPDRSSTPFQVTVRDNSEDFTLKYDPFSAIVIDDSRNPQ